MKQLSAEECLARILKDIEKRKTVVYSDKNSVRRFNAAMDRIIERANYFCDNYPEKMEWFTTLLDDPDFEIASAFTGTLFILHNATRDHKLAALASAKRLLQRPEINPLEKLGWTITIERWESELQGGQGDGSLS